MRTNGDKMKIYLDIDGVLLKKNLTMPEYGVEFIQFLITNFDCYWLTTHCRGGHNKAVDYLSKYYPASTVEKLRMIKQTDWTDLKTEAMDLHSHFIWLEDFPFESEKLVLRKHNKIDALITINLNRKDELELVEKQIQSISAKYNNSLNIINKI